MTNENNLKSYMDILIYKLSQNDLYWSSLISKYLSRNQFTHQDIINLLKCNDREFQRLSLCKLPRNKHNNELLEDLQKISSFTGIKFEIILKLFRECIAIESFSDEAVNQELSGYLNAARKRESTEENKESEED